MPVSFCKLIASISLILTLEQAIAQSSVLVVPYHANNKWGFCDTLANIAIKPEYDSVDFFNDQRIAFVYKKGAVNIVDSAGKRLLKDYYDDITISNNPNTLEIRKKKLIGLYDLKNHQHVLEVAYDEVSTWYNKVRYAKKKKKGALFSLEGKQLTDFKFDSVAAPLENSMIAYSGGKAYDVSYDNGKMTPASEIPDPEWAKFEDEPVESEPAPVPAPQEFVERIVTKFNLDSLERTPLPDPARRDGEIYRGYHNHKTGFYFRSDRFMMEPKYDALRELMPVRGGKYYMIAVYDGKCGVIDQQGQHIIPFEYDNIYSLNRSFAFTLKQGKEGVWMFNTIYPPIKNLYDKITFSSRLRVSKRWSFLLFKVRKNNTWGYVGENGVEYFK